MGPRNLSRKCHTGTRNTKTPRKSLQEPPLIKGVSAFTVYPYLDVSQRADSILEHVWAALPSWLWLAKVEERVSQSVVPPMPNILSAALCLSLLRNFRSSLFTLRSLLSPYANFSAPPTVPEEPGPTPKCWCDCTSQNNHLVWQQVTMLTLLPKKSRGTARSSLSLVTPEDGF